LCGLGGVRVEAGEVELAGDEEEHGVRWTPIVQQPEPLVKV
jgi:hypothetical protein